MTVISQNVEFKSRAYFHNLHEAEKSPCLQTVKMDQIKNGGPNFLKEWRDFRGLTQEDLAEIVDTSASVISYLENGERGLSARWLRKLAPPLDTTPAVILDHDPRDLDADLFAIWANADQAQRRQIIAVAKAIIRNNPEE